ncbi:MAG: YHYH protein [Verrucomicrobiota bacterium]
MKRFLLAIAFLPTFAFAHLHHEDESHGVIAPAATQYFQSKVKIRNQDGFKFIDANGIPDHPTGEFPNRGNPNPILEQNYHFRVTENPKKADKVTVCHPQFFGVALNGVPFDPTTAEFWNRDPHSGWLYEALYRVGLLGMDENNGHVQPNGGYHYHGLPTGYLKSQKSYGNQMTLVGYAADGFPIYGPLCPSDPKKLDSPLRDMKSSHRVKSGQRPSGPGGNYTGEFSQDFEYVSGLGDLDECNGREGVTPEYPQGAYYYVLTEDFPHVPRAWRGTPDQSFFTKHGPPGGPGGPGHRPPPPQPF